MANTIEGIARIGVILDGFKVFMYSFLCCIGSIICEHTTFCLNLFGQLDGHVTFNVQCTRSTVGLFLKHSYGSSLPVRR